MATTREATEIERHAFLDGYAEAKGLCQQRDHAVIFPFGT